jgi:ubiquinone/menaquinone biosynthesis C-methylase UbiE
MPDDKPEALLEEEAAKKKEKIHKAWTMATGNYADYIEPHFAPLNKIILNEVIPSSPEKCLDVAAGAGEPALSLAAALSKSKVTGIDFCESMVSLANQRAKQRNIANCTFQIGDAEKLSAFADNEFDIVTCRQSLGFFPQPQHALSEFLRVLKSNGKLILTVWGPKETAILPNLAGGLVNLHFDVPQDPNARPIWYWAGNNVLKDALDKAGFTEINVKQIKVDMSYQGIDELFEALRGTPQRMVLESASAEMVLKLKSSLKEIASDFAAGNGYTLPCNFMVGVGVKS